MDGWMPPMRTSWRRPRRQPRRISSRASPPATRARWRRPARGCRAAERQRLGIARAFLKGAPILILDEPTASLDALSEARVLDAIRRLRAGRTTFVIAHRLSTVREADRIIVMDRGQLIAHGTHAELVGTCALYAEMCLRLQFGEVA